MYKRHLRQMSLFEDPEYFGGIKLNKNNEWIKLANLIPWHEFEDEYADQFSSVAGQSACSVREALGTLIIKERYHLSDEATIEHLVMNPYLQYFIGLEEYIAESPFDASMLTRFRKRITPEMLQKVNDIIIGRPEQKEDTKDTDNDDTNDHENGGTPGNNEGTLILDATCAPQNIRFPTDVSLLNEARLNTEGIIDTLHKAGLTNGKKKPRTYRNVAKKRYNNFSKKRKKSRKNIHTAVGQQLRYLKRDLEIIDLFELVNLNYIVKLIKK